MTGRGTVLTGRKSGSSAPAIARCHGPMARGWISLPRKAPSRSPRLRSSYPAGTVIDLLQAAARHIDQGRVAEAEHILRRILATRPDEPKSLYLLAVIRL